MTPDLRTVTPSDLREVTSTLTPDPVHVSGSGGGVLTASADPPEIVWEEAFHIGRPWRGPLPACALKCTDTLAAPQFC